MSLKRLVYYFAIVSGWTALLGWMVAEISRWFFGISPGGMTEIVLQTGLVGAFISTGIAAVTKVSKLAFSQIPVAIAITFTFGGLGGLISGVIANGIYQAFTWSTLGGEMSRGAMTINGLALVLGWSVLGLGIGLANGLLERSKKGIQNGAVGGIIGGAVGGIAFVSSTSLIASNLSSRATAFVCLGISIGLMIGLVHNFSKVAWVQVVEGFGIGRELILEREEEFFGRSDALRLSFRGPSNASLPDRVFCIRRNEANEFQIVPASEVRLTNGTGKVRIVRKEEILENMTTISFGANQLLFRQKQSRDSKKPRTGATAPSPKNPLPPPPPKRLQGDA